MRSTTSGERSNGSPCGARSDSSRTGWTCRFPKETPRVYATDEMEGDAEIAGTTRELSIRLSLNDVTLLIQALDDTSTGSSGDSTGTADFRVDGVIVASDRTGRFYGDAVPAVQHPADAIPLPTRVCLDHITVALGIGCRRGR